MERQHIPPPTGASGLLKERQHIPAATRAAGLLKERCIKEDTENSQWNGSFLKCNSTPALYFTAVLGGNSEQKEQPHLCQDAVAGLIDTETSIN
jgi:hypothetical protein